MKYLTRRDELMLLSILRLGDNAYLVTLRELLNENTEKKWSIGNVFDSLDKLEEKGFIFPRIGEPSSKRGGKAVKYYNVTKSGIEALKAAKSVHDSMWEGLYDIVYKG